MKRERELSEKIDETAYRKKHYSRSSLKALQPYPLSNVPSLTNVPSLFDCVAKTLYIELPSEDDIDEWKHLITTTVWTLIKRHPDKFNVTYDGRKIVTTDSLEKIEYLCTVLKPAKCAIDTFMDTVNVFDNTKFLSGRRIHIAHRIIKYWNHEYKSNPQNISALHVAIIGTIYPILSSSVLLKDYDARTLLYCSVGGGIQNSSLLFKVIDTFGCFHIPPKYIDNLPSINEMLNAFVNDEINLKRIISYKLWSILTKRNIPDTINNAIHTTHEDLVNKIMCNYQTVCTMMTQSRQSLAQKTKDIKKQLMYTCNIEGIVKDNVSLRQTGAKSRIISGIMNTESLLLVAQGLEK